MTTIDIFAVIWFLALWSLFAWATGREWAARSSLSQAMNMHRKRWMLVAAKRELRMIDTGILGGLQNGTAFFASTTIFAIGGCFALMGATDEVIAFFRALPVSLQTDRTGFELKVMGLAGIFVYAFFKFGWSYRLFNYSSILFGAVPPVKEAEKHELDMAADQAAEMNILAGQNFNAGLRAIFMSMGYLGWFAGPLVFMGTSFLVIIVLVRRQFFSDARDVAAISPQKSVE